MRFIWEFGINGICKPNKCNFVGLMNVKLTKIPKTRRFVPMVWTLNKLSCQTKC